MANRKISDLTALTAPATGDLLPIVDISEAAAADKNKKITIGELFASIPLGTAAAPSVAFEGDSNTGIYSPGADTLAFVEGGAEAARIDSSGRLLVGTSTARSNFFSSIAPRLQLEGTDANSSRISLTRNVDSLAPPALVFGKTRGASIGSNAIVISGDNLGGLEFLGADGTNFIGAASIYAAVDGTPGANDMPGRLVFSTTADGASSPTERMRIGSTGLMTLAGPGIKFPATQVASADGNALDDYEEGTWTPDFRVNNSTAGVTYTSRYGFYTKIGNTVHLWGGVKLSNNGSSTGTVAITGIPFTPANIGSFQHPGQGACTIVYKANGTVWAMLVDTSSLLFRNQTATNADTAATDADFDDDTGILFTITYQTT